VGGWERGLKGGKGENGGVRHDQVVRFGGGGGEKEKLAKGGTGGEEAV